MLEYTVSWRIFTGNFLFAFILFFKVISIGGETN